MIIISSFWAASSTEVEPIFGLSPSKYPKRTVGVLLRKDLQPPNNGNIISIGI